MKTLQSLLSTTVFFLNNDREEVEMTPAFRVSVQEKMNSGIHFIIHPDGFDGATLDFIVSGNTLTPYGQSSDWPEVQTGLPKEGEVWYVQLTPRGTLVALRTLEITRHTVLLESLLKPGMTARHCLDDVRFIEKVGDL